MPTTRENQCLMQMKHEIDMLTAPPKSKDSKINIGGLVSLPSGETVSNSAGLFYDTTGSFSNTHYIATGTAAALVAHDHYLQCVTPPAVPNVKSGRQR